MTKIEQYRNPNDFDVFVLSEDAKKILRHFRDQKIGQDAYEYPSKLQALFVDVEACENALTELEGLKLVQCSPMAPRAANRVTASALSLDGVRYIAKNDLD
jgi:hypothetical protein